MVCKKNLIHYVSIEKLIARLLAKEFMKKEGSDYFGTYCIIVYIITTIRTLITLVFTLSLEIDQINIRTNFMNVNLEEEFCTKESKALLSLDSILKFVNL